MINWFSAKVPTQIHGENKVWKNGARTTGNLKRRKKKKRTSTLPSYNPQKQFDIDQRNEYKTITQEENKGKNL